jgi:hypothetical protein
MASILSLAGRHQYGEKYNSTTERGDVRRGVHAARQTDAVDHRVFIQAAR